VTENLTITRRHFLKKATVAAIAAPSSIKATTLEDQPPLQHQLDASALDNFILAAGNIQRLQSAVISSSGEVILNKAFRGPATNRAVNIKSVSKSLVSTLVGAAQQQGVIESVQQTLGELVPELIPKGSVPQVAELSIEDLLTMRAGLERVSGPAYGRWVNSDNWVKYVLTRPFIAEPGTRMLYSTGDTHVVGAVLARLTGQSLHSLSNSWLGKPLGISFAPWTRDPQGYFLGGNEMSLSPEHLIKVGELYLTKGAHKGNQILPANWVEQAFTTRTHSPYSGDGYGYGWFIRDFRGVTSAYARGFGGQVMHVIPERNLVVAMMSDTTQRARSHGYMKVLHDLVEQHLL